MVLTCFITLYLLSWTWIIAVQGHPWSTVLFFFFFFFSLTPGLCLQVTCVINNFQQLQPSPPPPRPQRPESMLGMPMVTLPSVESPLEKLSGPQVRGGCGRERRLRWQKRGWHIHPLSLTWILCPAFPPKENKSPNVHAPNPTCPKMSTSLIRTNLRLVLLAWNELWFYFRQRIK